MEFLSLNLENQSALLPKPNLLRQIIVVASIAAGVHLLGIPHASAVYILFCGPISGMLVQPIVGYYSDSCTSPFGRRRPFNAARALAVAIAMLLIGYAADMGHMFGVRYPWTFLLVALGYGLWPPMYHTPHLYANNNIASHLVSKVIKATCPIQDHLHHPF
ncbi:hypothetical protein HN51_034708 [Arachis hypogaea]